MGDGPDPSADEWRLATRIPMTVEFKGPYGEPGVFEVSGETLRVSDEYVERYGSFYVVDRGGDPWVLPAGEFERNHAFRRYDD